MLRTDTAAYGVQRFWVDAQTGFPVRVQLTRADGTLLFQMAFLDYELNAPVDAALFAYAPPASAAVREVNVAEASVQLGWHDVTLDQARAEAGFLVLTPAWLPQGMEQRFVRLGTADGRRLVAITYERDGRDPTVLLESGADFRTPDLPGAEVVTLNGTQARVTTVGNTTTVMWVQAGTRLTLTSSLPREEVLMIARNVGGPMSYAR